MLTVGSVASTQIFVSSEKVEIRVGLGFVERFAFQNDEIVGTQKSEFFRFVRRFLRHLIRHEGSSLQSVLVKGQQLSVAESDDRVHGEVELDFRRGGGGRGDDAAVTARNYDGTVLGFRLRFTVHVDQLHDVAACIATATATAAAAAAIGVLVVVTD